MEKLKTVSGFSLIEVIVVIVVLGIVAAVAMQSMTASVDDIRRVETEQEMDILASAIVGDASLRMGGTRADFGYVGDVGAFPPNLQALYQNPGGFATWDGPYIPPGFSQDADGYRLDGWGEAYAYNGVTLTSNGYGNPITKKIAGASSDYLLNHFMGTIHDAADSAPGPALMDSVMIEITIPDGSGSYHKKAYTPDSSGAFALDSLPVGTHPLRFIYVPEADTLMRYTTILPRNKSSRDFQFADAIFASGSPSVETIILRPDNAGSLTSLTQSGCAANYLCVNEVVSDGNGTCVNGEAGTFATDVYSIEDPVGANGPIIGVEVYCRARKSQNIGEIGPTVFINSMEYISPAQDLSTSWVDYRYEWTSNPATGTAWTWQDIIDLQAGVSLRGPNSIFPAYCTQVWVAVTYSN